MYVYVHYACVGGTFTQKTLCEHPACVCINITELSVDAFVIHRMFWHGFLNSVISKGT